MLGDKKKVMRQTFRRQIILSLILSPNAFWDKISDKSPLLHIVFLFAVTLSLISRKFQFVLVINKNQITQIYAN